MNLHHSCRLSISNSLCSSYLHLAVSINIRFAGLGRMKLKQYLHAVSQDDGKASRSPCSFFPGESNSFYLGSSFLVLGGWNDVDKMKLVFILFLCDYYSTALLKLPECTSEILES